jgi:hypothetical protein
LFLRSRWRREYLRGELVIVLVQGPERSDF